MTRFLKEEKAPIASFADATAARPQGAGRWLLQGRGFLPAVVLLALALRLGVVALAIGDVAAPTFDHNDFGWEMGWTARSIALGQGFSSPFYPVTGPTALVPPLFPYLLAGIFRLFGVYTVASGWAILGFNSLCSALTCLPLFILARTTVRRLGTPAQADRFGRLTALAWAIYPFAIYFAADRVWDYALTGLLFTCSLVVASTLPRHGFLGWLGFGVLYGVAVLSNPSVLTMLPFLLALAVWQSARRGPALAKAALAALVFLAICMPWTLRNARVLHAPVFLRDGFWLEFYAGNLGDPMDSNSPAAHPASNAGEMEKYQRMGELPYLNEKRDLALAHVRAHPVVFAGATARRVFRFWTGFWSVAPAYLRREPLDIPNVPFCIFLLVMMVRGIVRWGRLSMAAIAPYLIAVAIFPVPYYLSHASTDYRQPIEPIVILLVVGGLFRFQGRASSSVRGGE